MGWPQWNLAIPQEVARFVNATEAYRQGLRPRAAGDLRDDPARLAAAIYDELRSRDLGYSSVVLGDQGNQQVQTPDEILTNATPNCVDLTVLFASICLASDVVPLIGIITKPNNTRHTVVWVVPNAHLRARRPTDLGPIGGTGHVTKAGPEACAELIELARHQGWIGIETTGVCRSNIWSPDGDGPARSLPFDEAIEQARRVADGAVRIDVIDVHRLQSEGLAPHDPPELTEAQRRRRSRITIGAAAVAACVLIAITALVWRPWSRDAEVVAQMAGDFNIAVATLAAGDDDDARDALSIANRVADSVELALEDDPRYLVWGPDLVGAVTADGVERRAEGLGADVLVHGQLDRAGRGGFYRVDFAVTSAQHSRRAPWPMTLDEQFEASVSESDVAAGLAGTEDSIVSFGHTLDAIAALLADRHDVADDRLRRAEAVLGPAADPQSLIHTLRAWSLLVRAGIELDPDLVEQAATEIDEALRIDPDSEFARMIDLSVEYLRIIPVPAGPIDVSCSLDAPPPAALADIERVRDDVEAVVATLSPPGRAQALSLLGRLAAAEQLARFAETGSIDFGVAVGHFQEMIDMFDADEGSPALKIWASDAHAWLGRLALADPDATVDAVVEHFVDAAAIATPYWASRSYGLAGWTHRCLPGGSPQQAVCYFELAADIAQGPAPDESAIYLAAADEQADGCPAGWSPGDPA
jgi:hypothetical protein